MFNQYFSCGLIDIATYKQIQSPINDFFHVINHCPFSN